MESYTIKTRLLHAYHIKTKLTKLIYVFSKEFQVAKLVRQVNIEKAESKTFKKYFNNDTDELTLMRC